MSKASSSSSKKSTVSSKKATTTVTPVAEEPRLESNTTATATETVTETTSVAEAASQLAEAGPSVAQYVEQLLKAKQEQLGAVKKEIVTLRRLLREHHHELKESSKRGRKKKAQRDNTKPRKPSGFAEPVLVSDTLYDFLSRFGIDNGSLVARTEVTKHVIEYIKQNNLQNPEHRREIVPDKVLTKVFGPAMERRDPEDNESPMVYSYMKLQKYLTQHFPKRKVLTESTTTA